MQDRYEPLEFEAKWRQKWKDAELFKTRMDPDRPKFYGLDFFPYPSGAGLSVGHCRNYIPSDVIARAKVMQGFSVLRPMGFDAFGLPAENEAIKRKRAPGPMIREYGETYRRQLELVGCGFDWDRCFYSSDPSYYKWTQWIFKKLYEHGLAYRSDAAVNWCPKDRTALANEEVVGGLCERCGTPVEKKYIPQWYFKITEYAQRLIDDLDTIDWPEGIKAQQRSWIGRSEGVEFSIQVAGFSGDGRFDLGSDEARPESEQSFKVFTTRIDTIFGMTFCVLAPEHQLVDTLMAKAPPEKAEAMKEYRRQAQMMGDAARQMTDREKTGVYTGFNGINPATGKEVPIYLGDYVLTTYGTGAIMAVPGHDQRDFDFAKKFGIPVVPVIQPDHSYLAKYWQEADFNFKSALEHYSANSTDYYPPYDGKEGVLMNSAAYSGKAIAQAQKELSEWMESNEIGERKVNYKLRDWLISRQRYWGCPIPIVHSPEGDMEAVSDSALPVELPEVDHYEPTGDGQSPLAGIPDFVNAAMSDGTLGHRETDTMGGFACSSWYFLRFCDPDNNEEAWNKKIADYWMPVDSYVGGAEHAVMHLLYARFWTKFFYDQGLISVKEPFAKLRNQGQVLAMTPYRLPREGETLDIGEDGILISFEEAESIPKDQLVWKWARMSKSKGNVVTPDEVVESHGADALRIFEMFVAPFDADVQWSNEGIQGSVRFLGRIFKLISDLKPIYDPLWQANAAPDPEADQIRRWTHQTIWKVTEDIDKFAFNTYVSSLMIYLNNLSDAAKKETSSPAVRAALSEAVESMILLLAPAAPHSADELWQGIGNSGFTYNADWPVFDESIAAENEITISIQVNGKLRDTVQTSADADNVAMESAARASAKVQAYLEGKTIVKVIAVPKKLVNFVVKD